MKRYAFFVGLISKEKRIAEELKTAKALGIQFSDDGKTLIKCPNDVKEVVIPYGINSIGDAAFKDCKNLQSVTIPDSVTEIGGLAFLGCTNLQSVTIGNSVTSIGNGAFKWCENLQSVTIPRNCKVANDAFSPGCKVTRR